LSVLQQLVNATLLFARRQKKPEWGQDALKQQKSQEGLPEESAALDEEEEEEEEEEE